MQKPPHRAKKFDCGWHWPNDKPRKHANTQTDELQSFSVYKDASTGRGWTLKPLDMPTCGRRPARCAQTSKVRANYVRRKLGVANRKP